MKFLNNDNTEINLKRSDDLPGFEVSISENVIFESPLNNPFFKGFKGINILQIPKKMKGFRNNPDLNRLLDPIKIDTGIKASLEEGQFVLFQPNIETLRMHKLQGVSQLFTNGQEICPSFINYGMHEASLKNGTVIGSIIVLHAVI